MERKIFTEEELSYLIFALEKIGCYGIDERQEEYKCPYWDWELKDEEGNEGDCSSKQSRKLCVLLKVVEQGELTLTLRDKDTKDKQKEKANKNSILQRKMDTIEQEIIERQQQLEEIDRKKRKIKNQDYWQ